eukprot:6495211-Alexandrium_andersonii.AAC.1
MRARAHARATQACARGESGRRAARQLGSQTARQPRNHAGAQGGSQAARQQQQPGSHAAIAGAQARREAAR